MSAVTATARARQAAERIMVDSCIVRRPTGTVEGAGGVITVTYATIYDGKCRIMVRTRERLGGAWQEVGEAQIIASRLELHLPTSAPEPLEGDQVEMTSSLLDPLMAGKVYAVRDAIVKTYLSARRVTVIEVSS